VTTWAAFHVFAGAGGLTLPERLKTSSAAMRKLFEVVDRKPDVEITCKTLALVVMVYAQIFIMLNITRIIYYIILINIYYINYYMENEHTTI